MLCCKKREEATCVLEAIVNPNAKRHARNGNAHSAYSICFLLFFFLFLFELILLPSSAKNEPWADGKMQTVPYSRMSLGLIILLTAANFRVFFAFPCESLQF